MELDELINTSRFELEAAKRSKDEYQIGYHTAKIEMLETMKQHTYGADTKPNDNTATKRAEIIKKIMKTKETKIAATTIAVEECAELIQAITRLKRGKINDTDNLSEEIADVLICIDWVKAIFGVPEADINTWLKYKINRCNERLDNGMFK